MWYHSELNAETSVNREPHCDGQWFLPADKVLHYVHLLCLEDTLAPQQRTELLEDIHVLLQCGGGVLFRMSLWFRLQSFSKVRNFTMSNCPLCAAQ